MTKRHRRKRRQSEKNGGEQTTLLGGDRPLAKTSEGEELKLTPPPGSSEPPSSVPAHSDQSRSEAPPSQGPSSPASSSAAPPSPESTTAPPSPDPVPAARETPREVSALALDELVARGDYVRAIPMIEAGLEETPNDLTLLLAAGRAYSCSGDYHRARVLLDQAFEAWPEDLRIQREMGIALFRRGLYIECAEALSIVCARSESDGEAYYYRGEALNRSGQTEDAMRTLEKAVRLAPHDPRALRSLGRIYDRLGMMDLASEMHGRARHPGSQDPSE